MKTDVCGVCGGDGFSCQGCNGVSQAVGPARKDSCGKCGGGTFGACGCDYKAINNKTKCAPGCNGVADSKLKVILRNRLLDIYAMLRDVAYAPNYCTDTTPLWEI